MSIDFPAVAARTFGTPRPANTARATSAPEPVAAAPPAAAAGVAAAAPQSAEQLRKASEAIQAIKDWLPEPVRTNLNFRVDEDTDHVVVSVVDADSGTVLRQIPADVVLRVAHNLQDFMSGLVDEVA